MRKTRENLRAYGGLACMCTLTAPGQEAGLVWDRRLCRHPEGVTCSGKLGCRVLAEVAELWNEHSRGWWRELNRVAKQRADRAVRRLGRNYRGGLLIYEWELQARGVWHLHFVLGMETPVERVWAFEYVKALRELGPSKGFGYVDAKPLRSPQVAEKAASYISKYLAKWSEDGERLLTGGTYRYCSVCNAASSAAQLPGRVSWIRFRSPGMPTMVHELGHNLGLEHAYGVICRQDGRRVALCSMQPQALARGVRPAGRSPHGARLQMEPMEPRRR